MQINNTPTFKLDPEIRQRIDRFVAERMAQGQVPGLALSVLQEGRPAYLRGYGQADLEQGIPVTEATPFAVGSTTKGMTALAVMKLVEEGRLDLDAPVQGYLGGLSFTDPRARAITLRQLLSHTSGLPASAAFDGSQDAAALERQVRAAAATFLSRDPGSGYEYANDGFNLAGWVIQQVSGLPYESYLQRHLFTPLGMQDTTFDPERAAALGLAQGYLKRRGRLEPRPTPFSRGYNPAGMAISSARDLSRYLQMLLGGGGPVVSSASLEAMWVPHADAGEALHYGLGCFLLELGGLRVVAHTGEILTQGSALALVPALGLAVGVLVNLDSQSKREITQGVLTLLLGGEPQASQNPPERTPSTFTPDPGAWEPYLGEYQSPQGPLWLYLQEGRLLGRLLGFEFELEPYNPAEFVSSSDLPAFEGREVRLEETPEGAVLWLEGRPFASKKSTL